MHVKGGTLMRVMLVTLVFLIISIFSLISGIIILQKQKTSCKRLFFALAAAVAIWSSSMALSDIASDAATSESFLRVSALGLPENPLC